MEVVVIILAQKTLLRILVQFIVLVTGDKIRNEAPGLFSRNR